MDGRSQVRQCNSIQFPQGKFDGRSRWQGFQILKNALYQIVVLSAAIPSNIGQDNAVVVQYGFLVLYVVFSHTPQILQRIVNETYMILEWICQAFFNCTLNRFIECVKSRVEIAADNLSIFHASLILPSIALLL